MYGANFVGEPLTVCSIHKIRSTLESERSHYFRPECVSSHRRISHYLLRRCVRSGPLESQQQQRACFLPETAGTAVVGAPDGQRRLNQECSKRTMMSASARTGRGMGGDGNAKRAKNLGVMSYVKHLPSFSANNKLAPTNRLLANTGGLYCGNHNERYHPQQQQPQGLEACWRHPNPPSTPASRTSVPETYPWLPADT